MVTMKVMAYATEREKHNVRVMRIRLKTHSIFELQSKENLERISYGGFYGEKFNRMPSLFLLFCFCAFRRVKLKLLLFSNYRQSVYDEPKLKLEYENDDECVHP